ncbi:DNA-binding transcriptional regulator, AcrR family [Paraoerskovia marina]|uniref:DNA-binding transcriptional regulator, AcrR family n=1 Tax=Paraoerskovia marina TaxID=545619 RepID=A0A1H1PHU8_9CELL|nr:TetR family transcriptional regulator [Paraoerskovia marina]SDS10714.1 DNA-binding transcriptional regulator, AcrR family [Paraoerskovia marina]
MVTTSSGPPAADGRRLRGERSRRTVLDEAVQVASVEGLDALSLGRLADAVGASKSGVAGLFASRESLQLATVARARDVFVVDVFQRGIDAPRGLPRLWSTYCAWVDHSRRRVFRGGCFFRTVASEYDARPGTLRDTIRDALDSWSEHIQTLTTDAVERGDLDAGADAELLAFQLSAAYAYANDTALLHDDDAAYDRALEAARATLRGAGADPAGLTTG